MSPIFDPAKIMEFVFSFALVRDFWPFWFFGALFLAARSFWLAYVQEYFRRTQFNWVLLELRIPREIRKTQKTMEQIFMALHTLRNEPTTLVDKWWKGEITMWFSCEIVSFGGEIHFYIKIPAKLRNMVEAAIYAQYQDVEIVEVEDYVDRLPSTFQELKAQNYELFGNELRLAKPDVYPIRTYVEFESFREEQELDPIANLLETLAKLKPQETIWIQILVRPISDVWKKEGEVMLNKLWNEIRTKRSVKGQAGGAEGQAATESMVTPGDVDVIKALERNISKPGFETLIRYLYIAPEDIFDSNFGYRSIISAFNQYASETLNKFAPNFKAWTRASVWFFPYLFPNRRKVARQIKIYRNYRERMMYPERAAPKAAGIFRMNFFHWGLGAYTLGRMVLNTEELATIFHLPTRTVLTGPLIKRVEARKVGPPAELPIYGEDEK